MKQPLPASALDQLFLEARTFNKFSDEPVGDDMLRRLRADLVDSDARD